MSDNGDKGRTNYLLALQEVEAQFDPIQIGAPKPVDTSEWVFEEQAAEILGLTKRALERRRQRGTGPAHHQRAGYTSYYLDDLDAWVASRPKAYRAPPGFGQ